MILGTKWQELKLLWEMDLSENYLTFLQIAAYFQCNILNYSDDLFEEMCPFFPNPFSQAGLATSSTALLTVFSF